MNKLALTSLRPMIEGLLYSKAEVLVTEAFKQQAAAIFEGYWEHEMKGWMSPSGVPHLFSPSDEHRSNHHPDIAHKIPAEHKGTPRAVATAQKHGYTRFGMGEKPGESIAYIHYDKNHPKGKQSAMHALRFLKPGMHTRVIIGDKAGMQDSNWGMRREFTASGAAQHIHGGVKEDALMEADPKPRVEKDHTGEPVIPTREQFQQYFEAMAANYIQDQLRSAQERWKEASDKAAKCKGDSQEARIAKANVQAIDTEIEVANAVLNGKGSQGL